MSRPHRTTRLWLADAHRAARVAVECEARAARGRATVHDTLRRLYPWPISLRATARAVGIAPSALGHYLTPGGVGALSMATAQRVLAVVAHAIDPEAFALPEAR